MFHSDQDVQYESCLFRLLRWHYRTQQSISYLMTVRESSEYVDACKPNEYLAIGYVSFQQTRRDINHYLIHHYKWTRPHQIKGEPRPQAKKNLNSAPEISCQLQNNTQNQNCDTC